MSGLPGDDQECSKAAGPVEPFSRQGVVLQPLQKVAAIERVNQTLYDPD